ncbi:hypothetical protein [Streptomyces viridosporus]|uniref:hypothetical protein n=1 Tax=Streptomyces viridosporus TaxID=67581 RepID=UPI003328FC21
MLLDLDARGFRQAHRDKLHDTYTETLEQIIEAKRDHKAPSKVTESEAEPGQVLDLMAALNASVQKARASRGEGEAEVHELPKKKAAKQAARRPRSA